MADTASDLRASRPASAKSSDSDSKVPEPEVCAPHRGTLYFAYGRDMRIAFMKRHCPNSVYIGRATVANFRWHINSLGLANMSRQRKAHVPGLVFEIDDTDLKRLELVRFPKYESVYVNTELYPAPNCLYRRHSSWIIMQGGPAAIRDAYGTPGEASMSREPYSEKHVLAFMSPELSSDGPMDKHSAEEINNAATDAMAMGIDSMFFRKVVQQFMPGRLLPALHIMRRLPSTSPEPTVPSIAETSAATVPSTAPPLATRPSGRSYGSSGGSGEGSRQSRGRGRSRSPSHSASRSRSRSRSPKQHLRVIVRAPTIDDSGNGVGTGEQKHQKSQSESAAVVRPPTPVITVSRPSSAGNGDNGRGGNKTIIVHGSPDYSPSACDHSMLAADDAVPASSVIRAATIESLGSSSRDTSRERSDRTSSPGSNLSILESDSDGPARRRSPRTGLLQSESSVPSEATEYPASDDADDIVGMADADEVDDTEDSFVDAAEQAETANRTSVASEDAREQQGSNTPELPEPSPKPDAKTNEAPSGASHELAAPVAKTTPDKRTPQFRHQHPPLPWWRPHPFRRRGELAAPRYGPRSLRRPASFNGGRHMSRLDQFLLQASDHPHFYEKRWLPTFRTQVQVRPWTRHVAFVGHQHHESHGHHWYHGHQGHHGLCRRRKSF